MQAIETLYQGYKFRSRLEARWAVFFDAMGIKYQYEPEGFEFDGIRYLPDFYLPELNYFVEVKGMSDHLADDIERVQKFVIANKCAVIILTEIPYDPSLNGLFWFPVCVFAAYGGGCANNSWAFFRKDEFDEDGGVIIDDFSAGVNTRWFCFNNNNESTYKWLQGGKLPCSEDYQGEVKAYEEAYDFRGVEEALRRARQARFEHGEKPNTLPFN